MQPEIWTAPPRTHRHYRAEKTPLRGAQRSQITGPRRLYRQNERTKVEINARTNERQNRMAKIENNERRMYEIERTREGRIELSGSQSRSHQPKPALRPNEVSQKRTRCNQKSGLRNQEHIGTIEPKKCPSEEHNAAR
jgi:hypothetical protein